MRKVLILLAVLAIGLGAWAMLGGVEQVTASRIESTLVDKGIPQPVAACMGSRMAERLSLNQLRKLQNMQARDGETEVPLSMAEFLERLRRVDDPEAIEVVGTSAAICSFTAR
ncbi:hypothetical protein K3172_06545 [Qipengyuania sp. 6B39]|uniref:hypothetical protein n=1 Tax=Qipengyuania proteolytica TaxID=2867239 RepID=UPI001C8A520C|nr:hypothetical protein [Qipengyuania proteolytica]MBX7495515.1 hypothetical protein [Qipengyuania proteolytica]